MVLSEEQLKLVKDYASVFYSPKVVALLLQVNVKDFVTAVNTPECDIHITYWSAFYTAEFEVRQVNKQLAISGSLPATNAVLKYITDAKLES